ncbi:MAG TPA: nitrogen regulation protein NR(I) [Terriglobales bacterium]|nr:nitrogen regulation protein NR(I) [Terriglobales bacterium]
MSKLTGRILIADDEESIRWVLGSALADAGHSVVQVDGGTVALERLIQEAFDVALVDIRMPDLDGLTMLTRLREAERDIPVIVITAQNTMANAIEAMKRGAYDYVTKPFDLEEIQLLVTRALEMRRQTVQLARIEKETRRRFELGVEIVGKTPAMQDIFKTIGRVAHTDATVLIEGESGTGKELIGRALHFHSPRWSGPFVALNCSAVPRELLESELFGHEKGAFTGATEQRLGVFETAKGGTLLLDEVGDMPLDLQPKLLRVIQERELTRVGGREVVKVDCRIVAATNLSLDRAVQQGKFREDLFFRLNVVPITVPPLRQRRGDIPELINYFLEKINRDLGTRIGGISREAQDLLLSHGWPGNVRELENTLLRAAVLAAGTTLMPTDLALARHDPQPPLSDNLSLEEVVRRKIKEMLRSEDNGGASGNLYDAVIQQIERPLIELCLEHTQGNQLRAAALLGINRNTLHKKITQLRIGTKPRPVALS